MAARRINGLIAGLVLLALLAAGCGSTATTQQQDKTTGANAAAPAKGGATISGLDAAMEQQLLTLIKADVKAQGHILSADNIMFASTQGVPAGYFRLVGVLSSGSLLVYGANEAGTEVKRLGAIGTPGNVFMGVSYDGTKLSITGGGSTGATITVDFQWDGTTFKAVGQKFFDPNVAILNANADLLKAGDMEKLMQGFTMKDILKADTNGQLALQIAQALTISYDKALEKYKAGNLPDALRFMGWSMKNYQSYFGVLFPDDPKVRGYQRDLLVKTEQMVPLVNDYAFFLSESGTNAEAEPLLLQVIQHAPDRTVAYLNLGDVEWNLGKKDAAKPYYKKYLELLGTNQAQAPARVAERLK